MKASCLCCQLTRVGDLEKNILHDIATILPLELERLAAKGYIVESPSRGREHSGKTLLSLQHLEDEVHSLLTSIACGPRLARHGVGRVPISSEGLAIDPGLRNSITGLGFVETHHLGNDSCGCKFDEYNMVETDLVERVLQGHAALYLVCPDHGFEYVPDFEDLAVAKFTASPVCPRNPVGSCENGTQVIRGMAPLSSQPAVVEVEPSDHSTNVEGSIYGIELVVGTGHFGTVGNDSAFNDGAENVSALLEF